MKEETKERKDLINIEKEYRRAKRKKSWLRKGNLVPLSNKETKAIRNRAYREQKRKPATKVKFELKYKTDMKDYLITQTYNVKGGFNYEKKVSTFKCYKEAKMIFETLYLRGIIENYFFTVDYEPGHAHTHFIMNAIEPSTINLYIRNLFNRYKQGYVFTKIIDTEPELDNALDYCVKKLEVNRFIDKKGIDYWDIRTAENL